MMKLIVGSPGGECATLGTWTNYGDRNLRPWNLYYKSCGLTRARICQRDLGRVNMFFHLPIELIVKMVKLLQ